MATLPVPPDEEIAPQRILRFEVHNVMNVRCVEVELDTTTGLFVIGGENGQGKTSTMSALEFAFSGGRDICEEPLRRGEETGYVLVETTDYIVCRTFDRAGTKVVVSAKDRNKFDSPQALLSKLICDLSFDPWEFVTAKDDKQVEMLRRALGLDFTALDAEQKNLRLERTVVGSTRDKLLARLQSMPFYPDAPVEEVTASDVVAEIQEANATNQANAAERTALQQMRLGVNEKVNSVVLQRNAISTRQQRIARLRAELDAEERLLATDQTTLTTLEQDVDAAQRQVEAQEAVVAALVDVDIATFNAQLQAVEETNAKVRGNRERSTVAQELDAAKSEWDAKTAAIKAIDERKERMVAETPFPVPGLSFGEKGLLFNGLPFAQECDSMKLRVSIAIAQALNPKLRFMLVRDGNGLDAKSLDAVRRLATEFDMLILMERVGDGEEVSVVISDGTVAENRVAAQAEGATDAQG